MSVIHGPPGTGKTTCLAAAVLSSVASGDTVQYIYDISKIYLYFIYNIYTEYLLPGAGGCPQPCCVRRLHHGCGGAVAGSGASSGQPGEDRLIYSYLLIYLLISTHIYTYLYR